MYTHDEVEKLSAKHWQWKNKFIWPNGAGGMSFNLRNVFIGLRVTCSEINCLEHSRASEACLWITRCQCTSEEKGIRWSNCKYLSLVTQRNNASFCTGKNLEENFIRDFIVLEILALWEKLCLLYQQHILTALLLFESKSALCSVVQASTALSEIITYGGNETEGMKNTIHVCMPPTGQSFLCYHGKTTRDVAD